MGSVWCKADKTQQSRSFSPKIPFNTATATITKWTNQVCQVYKKPKDARRPPRQPQRPNSRSGERPSISHPCPITEDLNNKGWRSATLVVPDYAPVPPPRKKRKRKLQELERNALSMNHLNRPGMLDHSTISLPDRIETEEFSRSSSTFVVRPILENDDYEILRKYDSRTDKDNSGVSGNPIRDELDSHPMYYEISNNTYVPDKTGFVNPSAVDKLSDISEEYIHSDDFHKRDKLERVTLSETTESNRETDMNILQHIYNISTVSKLRKSEESEVKAQPKTAWLRNILSTNETSDDLDSRDSDKLFARPDQRESLQTDRLHIMNGEKGTSAPDASGNKTPPTTPTRDFKSDPSFSYDRETTHSVLLEILNRNAKINEREEIIETKESIFQSNRRTNIIYKSSSTDKLADESFINSFPKSKTLEPTQSKYDSIKSTSKSYIITPPLYRRHTYHSDMKTNAYNPFDEYRKQNKVEDDAETLKSSSKQNVGRNPYIVQYKDYIGSTNRSYVSALRDLDLVGIKPIDVTSDKLKDLSQRSDTGLVIKPVSSDNLKSEENVSSNAVKKPSLQNHQSSPSSSRRSSITDSLQEFEMSIYDMLKESKRQNDSSDEEEVKKPKHKL